jgi:Ferritin-like domain
MHHMWTDMKSATNRRSFLKNGLATAGIAAAGTGLLAAAESEPEEHSGLLTKGDAALLRFAAAAEILETDFWVQYNELAGIQDNEFPGAGGSGNSAYTAALSVLDSDMAQYVHDNTDDEFTHQNFLNAYLASKGASTVTWSSFALYRAAPRQGLQESFGLRISCNLP